MQYTLLISALAATVAQAQFGSLPASEEVSVEAVLATALPGSLLAVALTNTAEAASEIAAEFATGTPSWFAALPSDIKTILIPSVSAAHPTAPLTTGSVPFPTANGTSIVSGTGASIRPSNSLNGTLSSSTGAPISSVVVSTSSPQSSAASTAGSGSSSSSGNGAAMPTALYGMGVAGVAGLMGVLAL